jgi:hypothetical protein
MYIVNIQTNHIASVVCTFMAAAVFVNIVKTFKLSGIYLMDDKGMFLYTIGSDEVRRLFVPLTLPLPLLLPLTLTFAEIPDPVSEDLDLDLDLDLYWDLDLDLD